MSYNDKETIFDTDFSNFLEGQKGNAVITGFACTPSTGNMKIDVSAGQAIVNGTTVHTVATTEVLISDGDASHPRKDIVIINSAGTITKVEGTPEAALPASKTRFQTARPKPPDKPTGSIVLAQVWVATGKSGETFVSDDVADRRVSIPSPSVQTPQPLHNAYDIVSPTWTAYPNNPIIDGDALFGSGARSEDNVIVHVGNKYYMFKLGKTNAAWNTYALESTNIFGPYTKVQADPVITSRPGGITYWNGTWYLYTGATKVYTCPKADFPTGAWTEHLVGIPLGGAGEWDDDVAEIQHALKIGSMWWGIYKGKKSTTNLQLGAIWSNEPYGGTWIKSPNNPLLTFGASGEWDDDSLSQPSPLRIGNTVHVVYEGNKSGGDFQVGIFTMPWFHTQKGIKEEANPIITKAMVKDWGGTNNCDACANPKLFYENGVLYLFVDAKKASTNEWRYCGVFYQTVTQTY